jgi:hypothetical protein
MGKKSCAPCAPRIGGRDMSRIYEIMDILKCTRDDAFKVYHLMDVDFSECTDAEFKQAVYTAAKEALCAS